MKILITGAAGFIGFYVSKCLLERGHEVVGLDNINDYYDINLKFDRLLELGVIRSDVLWKKKAKSQKYPNFSFIRLNLEDKEDIQTLFDKEGFNNVCHLAAQAGVRYSIENPYAYISSNISGFINILEGCRSFKIEHLVYASSSSVYGLNGKIPFSEKDSTNHPVSLYAATKKANELMAHTYSHLYKIPTTGLRFFTVYGPWGRPDMSPFLFIDSIMQKKILKVFNNGDMLRDFTYIEDVVEGIMRIIDCIPAESLDWDSKLLDPSFSSAPYRIFNVGNSSPTKLMDYIRTIENIIGFESEKEYLLMQAGDVYQTSADTAALEEAVGFKPDTLLSDGLKKTVNWFKSYYKL